MQRLQTIRAVFDSLGIAYVAPYITTVGDIVRKQAGKHIGLYYIYPEKNFYFGKATKGNNIIKRHYSHKAKMDVNLRWLYSKPRIKVQPRSVFPEGWKAGVLKYLVEGVDQIPDHFVRLGPKQVAPGVLDFPVKHIVDTEQITVLLWDLSHLTDAQIGDIEQGVINALLPYCNTETHQMRVKGLLPW